jgi:hypothetical protein
MAIVTALCKGNYPESIHFLYISSFSAPEFTQYTVAEIRNDGRWRKIMKTGEVSVKTIVTVQTEKTD